MKKGDRVQVVKHIKNNINEKYLGLIGTITNIYGLSAVVEIHESDNKNHPYWELTKSHLRVSSKNDFYFNLLNLEHYYSIEDSLELIEQRIKIKEKENV